MMGKIRDFLTAPFSGKKVQKTASVQPVKEKKSRKAAKEKVGQLLKEVEHQIQKKQYAYASGGSATYASRNEAAINKSYESLRSLYSEAPGAIQCGNVIKNRILGGGFFIKPVNEGEEIDETDPEYIKLSQFLLSPNKEETLEDIFTGLIQNYIMYGNAFLEKVYGEGKVLEEVYNLNTQAMRIVVDKELREKGIEVAKQYARAVDRNRRIVYELHEVVHFRMPDPNGSLYGKAILEDHQAVLSMVIGALLHNVNFLKNNGRNQIQIVLPPDTDENVALAFKNYYEKEYSGPENSGKALITFGGAEAKQIGSGMNDIDYLNLMNFCKREVAGMFGVPLVMISDPEGSNRATSVEERKGFHVNFILPEREKLLRKFNREVINAGLGIKKYELDVEELDVEDQGKRTTEAKEALIYGLATPNEAAAYAGWSTTQEDWADDKYIISGGTATRFEDLASAEPVDPNAPTEPVAPKEQKDPKKKPDKENPDANQEKKKAVALRDLRKNINAILGY